MVLNPIELDEEPEKRLLITRVLLGHVSIKRLDGIYEGVRVV